MSENQRFEDLVALGFAQVIDEGDTYRVWVVNSPEKEPRNSWSNWDIAAQIKRERARPMRRLVKALEVAIHIVNGAAILSGLLTILVR